MSEVFEVNNQLLLNRVFTQNTLNEILKNGESSILKVVSESLGSANQPVKVAIEDVYNFLNKNYRNEYFYKNTLLNKLLLGRHSINTTVALAEIWLNRSKADFVLINGKAIVYEIKTELDTLDRLHGQINDYYKVFDHVEIITGEAHKNKVLEHYENTKVGVSILTKRNTIKQIRKPTINRDSLDYKSIYKFLRKEEQEAILNKFYSELPETDQFSRYSFYYKLFQEIPIDKLYDEMIKVLKNRSNIKKHSELFLEMPYELKSLLYFSSFKEKDYIKLKSILKEEQHVLSISKRKTI
ncbi:sce7726 family protein [Enterococcus faecium]